MTPEELFAIWAPDRALWSRWAKPVLFSSFLINKMFVADENLQIDQDLLIPDTQWVKELDEKVAIVVDLSNVISAEIGLSIARQGYRPVPLYNGNNGEFALINVDPLLMALYRGGLELKSLTIADDAPPVFLLDAFRMKPTPFPGRFDNRWITMPQDFPSANFLLSQQISKVIVLQAEHSQPQSDLAHVLLRWQEANIKILTKTLNNTEGFAELIVKRPPRYKTLWYRFLTILGLHRNSAGGFGAIVPVPGQVGHG